MEDVTKYFKITVQNTTHLAPFALLTFAWWRCHSLAAFYRATRMHCADYAVARCLSVRPSHAGIVCKRLHVSSKFFHHRIAPSF